MRLQPLQVHRGAAAIVVPLHLGHGRAVDPEERHAPPVRAAHVDVHQLAATHQPEGREVNVFSQEHALTSFRCSGLERKRSATVKMRRGVLLSSQGRRRVFLQDQPDVGPPLLPAYPSKTARSENPVKRSKPFQGQAHFEPLVSDKVFLSVKCYFEGMTGSTGETVRILRPQGGAPVRPHAVVKVTKQELGERLRNLRQSRGISQREVARLLGVDQSHVSNVERGVRGLTLQQVVKLSRGLDTSADEILNGGKRRAPVKSLRDGRLLQRLQRIQDLPSSQQQAILKILDGLLESHGKSSAN